MDLHNDNALGYNHDSFINLRDSEAYDKYLNNGADSAYHALLPTEELVDLIREKVMPVAPEGMKQVYFTENHLQARDDCLNFALKMSQ